ncbi:MAG: sodium-translocating pyrophosphatase, partial [Crocinitomicaceae bacterium TMED209]
MDQTLLYSVPAIAILGLLVMAVQAAWVRKQDAGEARMAEIANHIHEGALAFLRAEYRILAIFVVIAGALLGFVSTIVPTTHWFIVVAFVIGAVFSALAG